MIMGWNYNLTSTITVCVTFDLPNPGTTIFRNNKTQASLIGKYGMAANRGLSTWAAAENWGLSPVPDVPLPGISVKDAPVPIATRALASLPIEFLDSGLEGDSSLELGLDPYMDPGRDCLRAEF